MGFDNKSNQRLQALTQGNSVYPSTGVMTTDFETIVPKDSLPKWCLETLPQGLTCSHGWALHKSSPGERRRSGLFHFAENSERE